MNPPSPRKNAAVLLVDLQPDKVAQLHQLRLAFIRGRQLLQRLIQREQVVRLVRRDSGHVDAVQLGALEISAVTHRQLPPRAIDQNAPHRLGGGAEEMRPVFKRLVAQTQPRFVNQRGGLERVARILAGHLGAGDLAQLGVDLSEQGTGGVRLAALDGTRRSVRSAMTGSLRGTRGSASKGVSLGPITR